MFSNKNLLVENNLLNCNDNVCKFLNDLNIQVYTSNIHIDDKENTGFSYVNIVYDSLSEENKKIADEMVKRGLAYFEDIKDNCKCISLEANIDFCTNVVKANERLLYLASFFEKQDVLYGRKTIDEITSSIFQKRDDGMYNNLKTGDVVSSDVMRIQLPFYLENICSFLYTNDDKIYFSSYELLNKHLDYTNKITYYKKRK